MLAGFIVRTEWSTGSNGGIRFLLADHKRSIDLLEDIRWAELIILPLGKYNGQSGKWDGSQKFSKKI